MIDDPGLRRAVESLEGDFELVRELGRGATAVVYLLHDRALDRDVAMKVIRAGFTGDDEALARLQREARLVAQLTHPNIVKLYGTHHLPDGSFALLMEHVPGRNLKEVLREEGPLDVASTVEVLKDIASALAYAHRRRIVHRDVKPENIYIDEEVGAARLADFGVARPWDQDARLTLPGASLGTPAYMSPEQIDGKEVDGRTDVYSLGLVGYEMLLGHHPWEGENVFTIIYRQKNETLPIEELGLDEYPELAAILEKALQKDPSDRWESAVAFLKELSRVPLRPPETLGAPDSGFQMRTGTRDRVARRPGEAPPAGRVGAGTAVPDGHTVTRSPGRPPRSGGLAPVDWDRVEATGGRPLPPLEVPEESPEEEVAPIPVAGGAPRWRILVPAVLVAVVAGAYALSRWGPARPSIPETGPFPTTPSPSPLSGEQLGGGAAGPAGAVVSGPITLAPIPPDPPEGAVGSTLPLSVIVRRGENAPVADTAVFFEVVEGIGILEVEEDTADAQGRAEALLRLPNQPGSVVVQASLVGDEEVAARFEITAVPGPPQIVRAILGEGQSALPGEVLPEYLGVRVRDEFGNGVPGVEVRFQVLQGGGRVAPAQTTTDEAGRAFARWTLGNEEGTQLVAAVVPRAADALVTFQATARPRPAPARPPQVEEPSPEEALPAGEPVLVVARTFAVGGSHVCHLEGGRPVCRGANDRGQRGAGSPEGLAALAAGVSHACGLDSTGQAWCWGANEWGQLGDGTTEDRSAAAPVAGDARFSLLVAGLSHTCGLAAGGRALCWGRNVTGQLGDGTREDHREPTLVTGRHSFLDLAAGWNHTCGLAAGGAVLCWGLNDQGQVGDGSRVDRLAPTRVPGSYTAVAAGAGHTCAISGEEVRCWGDNAFGQLGDGSTEDRPSPVIVEGLPGRPVALAAGAVHTCVLLADRSAYCWGQNLHGQLGDGTTQNRAEPVQVAGEIPFVALFAGGGVTCGFARDGGEYCWGLNQSGQLGDGSRTNRSRPTRVSRGSP